MNYSIGDRFMYRDTIELLIISCREVNNINNYRAMYWSVGKLKYVTFTDTVIPTYPMVKI